MDMITLAMLNSMKKSGGVGYSDAEVILPSTKLELVKPAPAATAYVGGIESVTYELVVGQRYKVTWNGTDYDCTAFDLDGVAAVGNKVFYGLDDTGEPFSIAILVGEGLACCAFEPTATVSISTETIHPIDPKFLPDSAKTVVINLDNYGIGAALLGLFAQGGGETTIEDAGDFWDVLDKNALGDILVQISLDDAIVLARGAAKSIVVIDGTPKCGAISFGFAGKSYGTIHMLNAQIMRADVGAIISLKVT